MLTKSRIQLLLAHMDELYDYAKETGAVYAKLQGISRNVWVRAIRDGNVELEYNSSCNCHAELEIVYMPAAYLYDNDWYDKAVKELEERSRREDENQRKEAEQLKLRNEQRERDELIRLKAKYCA